MGILSDKDIKEYIKEGKLYIEPFFEENLTPNGYDLTIDEVFIPELKEKIKDGVAKVPCMRWFLISTKEYIKLGGEITGQLWVRTSYARRGVISSFGKVDAGFEGNLTLSSFNASDSGIKIKVGETFAQIIFEKMESVPDLLYEKRSGNYQGQKGVTLDKNENPSKTDVSEVPERTNCYGNQNYSDKNQGFYHFNDRNDQ